MMYGITKENRAFMEAGAAGTRDRQFLLNQLDKESVLDILDTKAFMLDPALETLKQACFESAKNFIALNLRNFIIAYLVFLILFTAITGLVLIVGSKRLKT